MENPRGCTDITIIIGLEIKRRQRTSRTLKEYRCIIDYFMEDGQGSLSAIGKSG